MKPTAPGSKMSYLSANAIVRLAIVLTLIVVGAFSFYGPSSASSTPGLSAQRHASVATTIQPELGGSLVGRVNPLIPFLLPQGPAGELISTFASNCTTGQTAFNLGQTVCAQVSGATPGTRRLFWGDPTFHVVKVTFITSDPQNDSFTPATTGTWTLLLVSNDGIIRGRTNFVVRDPANPSAEVSVATSPKSPTMAAGGQISFHIQVSNIGPDAALETRVTIPVPADATFASLSQDSGPSFICTNPPVGGTGSTICDITSLAKDSVAEFTATYDVSGSAAVDSEITNDVTATCNTADPITKNDTASSSALVVAGSPCTVNDGTNVTVDNDIISGVPQGGAVVSFNTPTTSGSCSQPVTCSSTSGSFFPIGETSVICVTDDSTNVSRFSIIVNDTATPSITCPADITVVESSPGSGSTEVNLPSPTVADNDPNVKVTFSPASGSTFTVAGSPHSVTATATDFSGHSASCTFNVTVVAAVCALSCPANITVTEDPAGSGSASVTFGDPTESGTCGTVTYDHASGSSFPIGTTTVTATSSTTGVTCQFNVTVTSASGDTEPPVISCPANIVQAAATGTCSANITPGTATATDNNPGVTVSGTRSDGQALSAPYPVGEVLITWTATDAAGNTAECQQSIQVTEDVKPSVTTPAAITTIVNASCDQVEVPNFLTGLVASDNCTPTANLEMTQSPAAETLVGVGVHPVTIRVTDTSGNFTEVTTTFTVVDNTPPVITLNGNADVTIECHTSFTDPGATASDACDTDVPVTATGTVDVNTPGTYVITYNAQDDSGNQAASVTRTVHVVDTTAPTITIGTASISIWPPNHRYHSLAVTDFVTSAGDSCDGSVDINDVVIQKVTSDEVENGAGDGNTMNDIIIAPDCKTVQLRAERDGNLNGRVYTITFKVTDSAGNTTTATAIVTVPKIQNGAAAVDDGPRYTVNSSCP